MRQQSRGRKEIQVSKSKEMAVVTKPTPKDEKDTLNQGFLPESMDGLKLVQNCACICIIQGKGPKCSQNSHRDQDPSTNALSIKQSNLNIK